MMKLNSRHRLRAVSVLLVLLASLPSAYAEQVPVPFRRAIDLALKRSGLMAIGLADQTKSYNAFREQQVAYIPTITFGSDIGYSFGVPPQLLVGTAPSLFNITTQSMLFNSAHKDVIRAAKTEWKATDLALEDKKNAVILDTAIAYAELDNAVGRIKVLREEQVAAQKAQFITAQRVTEGVDPQLELSRSKLLSARIEMRLADAEAAADVLREKLSKLTGIPAAQIETSTETLPQLPPVSQDDDVIQKALANNPAVKVADQRIKSAEFRARSEQRRLLPSVDIYTQYVVLAKYANSSEVYRTFERNNYFVAANVRFSFFNLAQRARAAQANADTLKITKEAEDTRNQISAETLQLQRSLRQLAATQEVARLEYEIAQTSVDQVQAKLEVGEANSRDQQQARVEVNDKYATYLEASLQLYRAQLQLMRSTGEIQGWALK